MDSFAQAMPLAGFAGGLMIGLAAALMLGGVAVVFFLTSVFATCPGYMPLGISTRPHSRQPPQQDWKPLGVTVLNTALSSYLAFRREIKRFLPSLEEASVGFTIAVSRACRPLEGRLFSPWHGGQAW